MAKTTTRVKPATVKTTESKGTVPAGFYPEYQIDTRVYSYAQIVEYLATKEDRTKPWADLTDGEREAEVREYLLAVQAEGQGKPVDDGSGTQETLAAADPEVTAGAGAGKDDNPNDNTEVVKEDKSGKMTVEQRLKRLEQAVGIR